MDILVTNKQKDLKISKRSTKIAVESLLSFLNVYPDEISIQFVTEKKIKALHLTFFGDPSSTDCITFPVDSKKVPYQVLGEVFICPKTAIGYAKDHKMDPYEECTLYLIHGVLHLIGYDDLTGTEKKKMRLAENRCLGFLKKEDNLLKK